MNEPRRSRSTLRVLFGVVIVDLIGFGIVVPVLPFYADRYGANGTVLGVIIAAYAAAQFVCAPIWGRLSDRIGRRPVMLMTIAGTALSLLFLGLADSVLTIFLARLLGGAFAANVSVASAYVSDVTAAEERTRWMGMLGASFGVGFVLGPAIGGVLAPYGYHVPMLTAASPPSTGCTPPSRCASPRSTPPQPGPRVWLRGASQSCAIPWCGACVPRT
jgi:DHA1 family tetracycline resistance protein-like MFS transporter